MKKSVFSAIFFGNPSISFRKDASRIFGKVEVVEEVQGFHFIYNNPGLVITTRLKLESYMWSLLGANFLTLLWLHFPILAPTGDLNL